MSADIRFCQGLVLVAGRVSGLVDGHLKGASAVGKGCFCLATVVYDLLADGSATGCYFNGWRSQHAVLLKVNYMVICEKSCTYQGHIS